nr:MAG TPA: hypothetical protein [Bacteriophage sp.]
MLGVRGWVIAYAAHHLCVAPAAVLKQFPRIGSGLPHRSEVFLEFTQYRPDNYSSGGRYSPLLIPFNPITSSVMTHVAVAKDPSILMDGLPKAHNALSLFNTNDFSIIPEVVV